jgi:hypothetical protein
MAKAGKGFVLLLDLDRVISAGERELVAQLAEDPVLPPPVAADRVEARPS